MLPLTQNRTGCCPRDMSAHISMSSTNEGDIPGRLTPRWKMNGFVKALKVRHHLLACSTGLSARKAARALDTLQELRPHLRACPPKHPPRDCRPELSSLRQKRYSSQHNGPSKAKRLNIPLTPQIKDVRFQSCQGTSFEHHYKTRQDWKARTVTACCSKSAAELKVN